jgi:hypothetical protein
VGVDLSWVFGTFCCVLDTFSTEARKKMNERITTVSGKMKELFQVSTQADKLVEEATAENLEGPDWGKSLAICELFH